MDTASTDHVLMVDDDILSFNYRSQPPTAKLTKCQEPQLADMPRMVDGLLGRFAMVGISARQGNDKLPLPFVMNKRVCNAYAIRRDLFQKHGVRFDRLRLMEDFDVILQLIEAGENVCVITQYCWQHRGGSNSKGGCSLYRDAEMQSHAAHQLGLMHPNTVRIVPRQSKSTWEGLESRVDVQIQWKQAERRIPKLF